MIFMKPSECSKPRDKTHLISPNRAFRNCDAFFGLTRIPPYSTFQPAFIFHHMFSPVPLLSPICSLYGIIYVYLYIYIYQWYQHHFSSHHFLRITGTSISALPRWFSPTPSSWASRRRGSPVRGMPKGAPTEMEIFTFGWCKPSENHRKMIV